MPFLIYGTTGSTLRRTPNLDLTMLSSFDMAPEITEGKQTSAGSENDAAPLTSEVEKPLEDTSTDMKEGVDPDMSVRRYEYESPEEEDLGDSNSFMSAVRRSLFPFGVPIQAVPLCVAFVALLFSFSGSWHCSYFKGADISFTGSHFGLWTLEDIQGKCQRWDVLFFNISLGAPLSAGRVFSMMCMMLGLSVVTAMSQALQFHIVSYGIFLFFIIIFVCSLFTTSIFNMWIIFFLFSYIIFILAARFAFVHPFHRRISTRGRKVIAGLLAFCGVCSILTLVVLHSDFCTCRDITSDKLTGRDPGDACSGDCRLGAAGYLSIFASLLYFVAAAAVVKWGVQHEELEQFISCHPELKKYDHYTTRSIYSRVVGNNPSTRKLTSGGDDPSLSVPKSLSKMPNRDFFSSRCAIREEGEDEDEDSLSGHEAKVANAASALKEPADDRMACTTDDRTRCHKMCCDYRVAERTRSETILFWVYRICLGFLVAIYVFIVIVLIGSRVENAQAQNAPDTSFNFITPVVCAFNPLDPSAAFQNFESKGEAVSAGFEVVHCGSCGVCSNPHDLETYILTRKTIAKSAKKCGPKAILGSDSALSDCLQEKIDFTRDCTKCWADNMKNTAKKCIFTCMTTLFTGFMSNNNVPGAGEQGWLNQCLFCDEKQSGPAFVTCSGVARRRLGIRSEIERNPEEQCSNVEIDWVTADFTELFPATSN